MRPLALVTVCLLLASPGCESYWERRELEREIRDMEPRRDQLREQIRILTAGKTTFTEQEKAVIGPLWIELRGIEGQIEDRERQLRDLN